MHVNVSPAAAVDFQHFKDKITEKINSYFGYKLINEIKLQTINFEGEKTKNKNVLRKFPKSFEEKVNEIKNKNIKNSLSQLLKTIKND